MNAISKILIPEKEWLLKEGKEKLGSITKDKKGFTLLKKGQKYKLNNAEDLIIKFGIDLNKETVKKIKDSTNEKTVYSIYDFPCSSKPFDPIYNLKKKLPLFAKSDKSKSQYCAGYYVIKFRKGWVKSFCPKLITLERYPFNGPFKTEQEMKTVLNTVNKL